MKSLSDFIFDLNCYNLEFNDLCYLFPRFVMNESIDKDYFNLEKHVNFEYANKAKRLSSITDVVTVQELAEYDKTYYVVKYTKYDIYLKFRGEYDSLCDNFSIYFDSEVKPKKVEVVVYE